MTDCVEYTYFGYFVPNINLCTKPFYFICEVPSGKQGYSNFFILDEFALSLIVINNDI